MSNRYVLGIDPGVTGAMAVIDWHGGLYAFDWFQSADGRISIPHAVATLRAWGLAYKLSDAVVENVASMPKQGASTGFTFGRAAGVAETLPLILGLPVHLITPTEWKRHHRLSRSGKDASRLLAARLWPDNAADAFKNKGTGQAVADAALLARAWIEQQ